jgi:hypothetical protein
MSDEQDRLIEMMATLPEPTLPYWDSRSDLSPAEMEHVHKNYDNVSLTWNADNFKKLFDGARGDNINTLMDGLGDTVVRQYNGLREAGLNETQSAISRFDPLKFRLNEEPAHTGKGASYIFITRPPLNLLGIGHEDALTDKDKFPDGTVNLHHLPMSNFYLYSARYKEVYLALASMMDRFGSAPNKFMPVLSNFAEDFNGIPELTIETEETTGTFEGRTQVFAKTMEQSYGNSGSLNVTYFENSRYFVMLTHLMWVSYIGAVARGKLRPSYDYNYSNIMDYTSSLFFVRTCENMVDIDFIAKFIIFPTNAQQNLMDGLTGGDFVKPNINYRYLHVEHNIMNIIGEFNDAGGGDIASDADIWGLTSVGGNPTIKYDGDSIYKRICTRPYITSDGKLLWVRS